MESVRHLVILVSQLTPLQGPLTLEVILNKKRLFNQVILPESTQYAKLYLSLALASDVLNKFIMITQSFTKANSGKRKAQCTFDPFEAVAYESFDCIR